VTRKPGADEPGAGRPPGGEDAEDELTLEARLQRLERIVASLEGGDVELERGLELFEEGVRHIRAAEALLSRAELRVEELVGEVESLEVRPFEDFEEEPEG
jgi:exodeoxyribonuclease VII small subunit